MLLLSYLHPTLHRYRCNALPIYPAYTLSRIISNKPIIRLELTGPQKLVFSANYCIIAQYEIYSRTPALFAYIGRHAWPLIPRAGCGRPGAQCPQLGSHAPLHPLRAAKTIACHRDGPPVQVLPCRVRPRTTNKNSA